MKRRDSSTASASKVEDQEAFRKTLLNNPHGDKNGEAKGEINPRFKLKKVINGKETSAFSGRNWSDMLLLNHLT